MLYNNKFVKSLLYQFDIEKLRIAYKQIIDICPIDKLTNQLCLTHRKDEINTWYGGNGSYFGCREDGTTDWDRQVIFEEDFTEFNEKAKHTYFYEVYKTISQDYVLGRVRIMAFPFKGGLSWHRDLEYRIHVPIITSTGAFMVFEDIDNMIREDVPSYYAVHFPADGSSVIIDPRGQHTAFNEMSEIRVNLLLDVVSDKNGNSDGLI